MIKRLHKMEYHHVRYIVAPKIPIKIYNLSDLHAILHPKFSTN